MAWPFAADEAPDALVLEADETPATLAFEPALPPADMWFEEEFMALVRFSSARDYVAGFIKAFGDNSAYIPAVTLVDSTGAAASGGGDASAANQATQIAAEQAILAKIIAAPATEAKQDTGNSALSAISGKLPATLGIKTAANSFSIAPASDASFAVTGTFWQATQPVSGTVTANLGTIAGVATETTLAAASAKLPASLGAKSGATSFSVVPCTDTAFPASQSGTWNITNVSGTVSLPTGAATSANQSSELTLIGAVTETAPATDTASSGLNGRAQRIAQRLTSLIALIPSALGAGGGLKVDGSGTALPVSGPQTNTEFLAALRSTATHSSVNSGASSVTILASNANRKGAIIMNTDANALYLDLSGGTAVAASRAQKKLATDESYEVPFGLTGAITGIWTADGSGVASVVEFA